MNDEIPHAAPANRSAVISAIAALLTLLSFCTAVAPIPLTGWVCYPAAALLGIVALVTGVTSLGQMSRSRENGRLFAWTGITVGTLAIVGTACAVALAIAMFPKFVGFMQEGVALAGETGRRIIEFLASLKDSLHP